MTPYIQMRLANKAQGSFRAEGNTLWLYDFIASDDGEAEWMGGVAPNAFVAALKATTGPVTLRINSPGGSVFGAQAMVAAMREHPHAITARVDSLAASAASVIAVEAAALEMAPGAMLMIHKAWGVAMGNADDMLSMAEVLEKIDGQIAASYRRKAGDKSDFAQMMAEETWFTAEEAVDAGLADRVIAENTQRVNARWDLSAYAKAPALAAPEPITAASDAADMRAARVRQTAARLALAQV